MQWDGTPTGGFTTATSWLPLVDPATRNVADQADDPASLLALYRRLIAARRDSPALARGEHRSIFGVAPDVLAWLRETDGEVALALLNTGTEPRICDLSRLGVAHGEVLVATSPRTGHLAVDGLRIEPLEGIALRL
jgi:glycosidase